MRARTRDANFEAKTPPTRETAMRLIVLIGATALALGAPAVAQAADELTIFSNPGTTVICRYSSFSGVQELKCADRRVKGEDGGPLTLRLHRSERTAELIFDPNPIEKKGRPAARFARPGFTCTLTAAAVRCTNAVKHGFVMKLPKQTVY
jgi:hypothetical protein